MIEFVAGMEYRHLSTLGCAGIVLIRSHLVNKEFLRRVIDWGRMQRSRICLYVHKMARLTLVHLP